MLSYFNRNSSTFISLFYCLVLIVLLSFSQAEAEVNAFGRRIQLLEDDLEQTEGRLVEATSKLEEMSKAAEESER